MFRNILIGMLCMSVLLLAAPADSPIADAAMKGQKDVVRSLIKQAADVSAAQGDGMTALHWAALNGDLEMAQMLIYAGANLKASTRLGGYTPLFMAAKTGHAGIVDAMLKAGADPKGASSSGVTALMMAASSGDRDSVKLLLDRGADPNAKESDRGQTALAFAASFNRPAAIQVLLQHGANPDLASNLIKPASAAPREMPAAGGPAPAQPVDQAAAAAALARQNGGEEGGRGGGNPKGQLTPLMYAARQGSLEAARSLVEGKANLDALSGDDSTALLLAIINGQFDIAKLLVDHGADVKLASMDGATPLYGVFNNQWARKSFQPQPTPRYEKTTYLELAKLLLDKGADPNARITKELWYTEYNRDLQSVSVVGATAFWKCADVGDIEGMRLLISRGGDPNIATTEGVTPLLIAAGAGVHGNDDVTAPTGRMAAVKYLVEELRADVNAADIGSARGRGGLGAVARDQDVAPATQPEQPQTGQQAQPGQPAQQGQQPPQQAFGGRASGGYTALHNAAARGDNEMILYLVSKGANPNAVSKSGVTIADMANGPRQRIQPYPETVALLEILGSKNSHRCVSC